MNFDAAIATKWLDQAAIGLPGLPQILHKTTSEVLIIGAGVFDIYFTQGWIPAFKRKTGDLDLSVGIFSGESDYEVMKTAILAEGYTNSDQVSYRFFSPKQILGGLTYLDLLAHPAKQSISAEFTRSVMGAGPDFSFEGFELARTCAFKIDEKLSFPNPISMVGLKRAAYLDNPEKRVKDLADIAELSWGIVEKGTHFEMSELWEKIKSQPEAKIIRATLLELGSSRSVKWDLENARQELLKRNFSGSEIDDLLPERMLEWASYMPI